MAIGHNSRLAWMPMYFSDWLGDTMHLSTVQHGAYFLLAANYWITRKPLVDDNDLLAAITKTTMQDWLAMRPVIEKFFIAENEVLYHARLELELQTAQAKYKKAVESGRRGGKAKALASARKKPEQTLQQKSTKPLAKSYTTTTTTTKKDIEDLFSFIQTYFKKIDLPVPESLTQAREKKLKNILEKCETSEEFKRVVEKINNSPFLLGNNDRGWKVNFDWFLNINNFIKIKENSYSKPSQQSDGSPIDAWQARMHVWKKSQRWFENQWGPPPNHPRTIVPKKYREGIDEG